MNVVHTFNVGMKLDDRLCTRVCTKLREIAGNDRWLSGYEYEGDFGCTVFKLFRKNNSRTYLGTERFVKCSAYVEGVRDAHINW